MDNKFEMVAKTFQGLEEVLAEELRQMGAENVMPGRRMVSFEGDLEMLYRANLQCRTALRILKPFYKFTASDPDTLYEMAKEFDWGSLLTINKTFAIDSTTNSEEFRNSLFVTYRVKDAIVDWFKDRLGENQRPGVRLNDADVLINVHISGSDITLSLDSSGESLHKRGYRVANTEAPINEVMAAGIILRSGWRGDSPLVDPMCGSGTFLIEAALIAANIYPGIYRRGFAFERWADFDSEIFDRLYNDDSAEREVKFKIYGSDISAKAIEVSRANIKSAGVAKYIELERRSITGWEEAPQPAGVLVMNPPYGERIAAPDMEGLYGSIGSVLKHVFMGYHAWIIGYNEDYMAKIGLAPSEKLQVYNGGLECQLREYVIFDGTRDSFVSEGGKIGKGPAQTKAKERRGDDRRGGRFGDRRDDDRRGGRFGDRRDDDRRGGRFGDRRDEDRRGGRFGERRDDDRRSGGFPRRDDRRQDFRDRPAHREPEQEPENPLAVRRNPHALKFIEGRRPKLFGKPVMRSRGWKKKNEGEGGEQKDNNQG